MRLGLLLLLAAVPFLEIALLIKVGQAIGFWPTLLLVVLSASFGSYVLYEQGFQVLGRAMATIQRGRSPMAPVIDGIFILLAGVLLIMPGFLTDAAGLALLVPYLRHRFAVWCLKGLVRSPELRAFLFGDRAAQSGSGQAGTGGADRAQSDGRPRQPPFDGEGPIIEGEFERIDEKTVDYGRDRRRDEGR